MNIELKEISVQELVEGFEDNQESGIVGYGGQLDIRPPYQREFIYKDKQRDAVINTIVNEFPLNVMYWAKREAGGYEIIDGQQRTISVCQYVDGIFSFSKNGLYFHNLQEDEKKKILDYKLMIYVCSGSDSEKLEWFKIINIAGEKLTDQELRNAVYHGSWVSDAKRYFSKTGCAAYGIGSNYLSGSSIRQEYLERAIKWKSNDSINDYMGKHQMDNSAVELWNYFQSVISWVEANFKVYRKEMKGIEWGFLYNDFKNEDLNPDEIEEITKQLMSDDEVTKRKGIYEYILRKDEKFLNLRAFTDNEKRLMYERQDGLCNIRKKPYPIEDMHADHITPWSQSGKTTVENGQMIHKDENRRKSNT